METDGLFDLDWLEEQVPDDAVRERYLGVLMTAGLLELLPANEKKSVRKGEFTVKYGPLDTDAWIMPDFLEHNEAKVEAEARRAEEAQKRQERREKAQSRVRDTSAECPAGQRPDTEGSVGGLRAVSAPSRPDPTRPDPTRPDPKKDPPDPPRGKRARDLENYRTELDAWVAAHPHTDVLAEKWEATKIEIQSQHGDPLMMAINYLHPHQLDDTPVFGSNAGGDAGRHLDNHRHLPILRDALGSPPVLIDCQCELTRDRAA